MHVHCPGKSNKTQHTTSNDLGVQLSFPCPKNEDDPADASEDDNNDEEEEVVADLTQDSDGESEAQTESDGEDGIRGSGSPTFYIINHVDEPEDSDWKPAVDESEPVLLSNRLTANSLELPKYVNVQLKNKPPSETVAPSPTRAASVKSENKTNKEQVILQPNGQTFQLQNTASSFTPAPKNNLERDQPNQENETEVQNPVEDVTGAVENGVESSNNSTSEQDDNDQAETRPKEVESESMLPIDPPAISHVTRSQPTADRPTVEERTPISTPSEAVTFAKRMAQRFATEVKNQPWYFGKIGRERSVTVLSARGSHGMYLVRDSDSTADRYTLSAYHGDKSDYRVAHYKIEMTAGFCHLGSSALQFANIAALITYYTNHQLSPKFKLTVPCPKDALRQSGEAMKELDKSSIALDRQIDCGNNKMKEMWQGVWEGVMDVSVAIVRKNNCVLGRSRRGHVDMLNNLQHRNIVSFYGIAKNDVHDKVYIVTEWMEKGSLLTCLQQSQFSNFLEKVCIAEQISDAMLYLQARKIVLRNLQAQNIAVTKHSECKLSNFETAEFLISEEYNSTEELTNIPAKWTAPEAAFFGKFTTSSDVWSYGVVLYEIFTDGKAPYPDMAPLETLFQIKEGQRMPHPTDCDCPMSAYELMFQCWQENPQDRPTFRDLREKLKNFYTTTKVELVVLKHTFSLLS
uniref:Tyrosine-protein kinase n=1 Tax=Phallusia mammillata TaxID=59560 RepID=A0A6F9DUK3_9ASCI|nr:proto-oncogene tyrosine-protein kinase Src-like [Phallusia mammillata]